MSNIIDFHSHILPGIDDGSASVQESIALLRAEAEQGITHVVATPHFYARHDRPKRFLARRYEAEMRLREEMEKYPDMPQFSVGAEVYFFPGMSDSDILYELTIDKKGCMLLEMPEYRWTDRMYREVEDIRTKQGIIPIMAHVDRYLSPFRSYGIPERLEQLPVFVQANASFFLRGSTRKTALRMLRKNQIHLLGSDCHNMASRKPNLEPAVQVIRQSLGQEAVDRICMYQADALPKW